MKNGDNIKIEMNEQSPTFQNSIVNGHPANKSLKELFRLRKNLNSPPELPSVQNRQFLRKKVYTAYSTMADTSSYLVIQMLAIYFINESFDALDQIDLMEKIQAKTEAKDTSSPYYKAFLNDLSYIKYQAKTKSQTKNTWIISIAIMILVVSVIINRLVFGKKSLKNRIDTSNLISQLSVQEKRVLDLLKEGKSNKEISQELHIEVSTVKSHLNKIYSQLGVKGRKEIINSNW